jgi:hypothetical protein
MYSERKAEEIRLTFLIAIMENWDIIVFNDIFFHSKEA